MFVDEVTIDVRAGRGGDGCVSFRREKYVPRGGPDGGGGGRGGSVYAVGDRNVSSLLDLRKQQVYAARKGQPGMGRNRQGADGEDCRIPVPLGTLVRDRETGTLIADLSADGQEALLARGGRGGRGNKSFATAIHQTPRESTPGEEGEERSLELELKLIADVGLVGLPNAGKSTLLSRLSAARPRIADYPFTTLEPQLGLVEGPGAQSLVLADIPGLIEGAHGGAGLGTEFLRHLERTSALAHIVDLVPVDGSDPVESIRVIERELERFSPELAARPTLLVGNKADLTGADEQAERIERELGRPILRLSAVRREGLDRFRRGLFDLVKRTRSAPPQRSTTIPQQESNR